MHLRVGVGVRVDVLCYTCRYGILLLLHCVLAAVKHVYSRPRKLFAIS